MALDGIYTHHLIKELQQEITQFRVESIWHNHTFFFFQFYHQKQRKHLIFNLNASFVGCYITKNPLPKQEPTSFVNQLKKYFEGGILTKIEQYRTDRVFIFNFTVYDFILGPLERQLIFEAMGKHANLYIVENGKIIDLYKKSFVVDGRHLIPNAQFEFFITEKSDATFYQYHPLLEPKNITEKYLGISLRLAKFLHQTGQNPYEIPVQPTLSLKENKSYFFNIFEGEVKHFNTLSEALDNRTIELNNPKLEYEKVLKDNIKKLTRKLEHLIQQKEKSLINLSYKEKGDYIYSQNIDLQLKLNFLDHVELDETKSLSQNAQHFYKLYQKAKRAIEFLDQEIEILKEDILVFEHLFDELSRASKNELIDFNEILKPYLPKIKHKNKKPHESKILTIHDQGVTYYVGKNAYQNEYLLRTYQKNGYFWFHVKDASGSHVVVKSDSLTESIIRTASMLAAYYSSQRLSSSIPVIYTDIKNVKRMANKPASLVKVKNEKAIYIDIDETKIHNLIHER